MNTLLGQSADDLDKRGAGHTAREIAQQPRLWRAVAGLVEADRDRIRSFLDPLLGRSDLRIVLTGAGTSAFAGEVLAPALARRLRRQVDAVPTTDLVSDPRSYLAADVPTLLVSFARSGNSPESVAATELAGQCLTEVHHLVVTCNAEGRLAGAHRDATDSLVVLLPAEADDQGFAMTSSFTCMVLAALLALGGPMDPADTGRMAAAADHLLEHGLDAIRDLAAARPGRVVYLGSGPLKGLAHESALKLLELSAGDVLATADSPLGFRHGPKAVLDGTTLVVVFLSNDPHVRRYDLDLVAELRATPGGHTVTTVGGGGGGDADETDPSLALNGVAGLDDVALALPAVLVAQLFALHTSLALAHTPDNPFPSGEVNRVVQGVVVHPLDSPPSRNPAHLSAFPAPTDTKASKAAPDGGHHVSGR